MRDKNFIVLIFTILILTNFISGCIDNNEESEDTILITDMAGRKIEVPKNVDTVVGLGAGVVRILIYLNCSTQIVGVEEVEKTQPFRPYNFAHPELEELPSLGPIHGGEPELITAAEPDLIFHTYTTASQAYELEGKTGIPVVALDYGDLDNQREMFYEALRLVGKIMERENRAEELITYIDNKISDLGERAAVIPEENKSSVYVGGIGYRGSHGILSTEPAYSPFEFLKANNTAKDIEQEHAFIDKEKLLEWNPEIMFVDAVGYELAKNDLEKDESYHELQAVENSTIFCVFPYNWYTANMGTILANAYYLGTILYPTEFNDINLTETTNEIYRFMLGKGVYSEMNEEFPGFEKIELEL